MRIPSRLIEMLEMMRQPGGPLAGYKTDNAMHVGIMLYSAVFPKVHALTAALTALAPDDFDLVLDFLFECRRENIDLGAHMPKPATAEALLKLARKWRRA